MFDPYRRRREKAAARREAAMSAVDFSLPVDGDLPRFRSPTPRAGDFMDQIVADLVRDRSPFFDEAVARWDELFPGLTARPGKWVAGSGPKGGGKLFLFVGSAAAMFALRSKLPGIKKTLAGLASAPERFSIGVEIHSAVRP